MALAAIPFGLAIGLAIGTLGGGGSVLAIPVLVYVLGENVHSATTASLVVVGAAALAGGLGHAHGGRVCWRYAIAFAPPAMAGVVVGTVTNRAIESHVLLSLFALVMLAAAWGTWRNADGHQAEEPGERVACPPLKALRTASAGFLVGSLTGLFGVGGGFVVVPVLALVLGFSMRSAIGTSLVIVSGVSTVGVFAHLASGAALDGPVVAVLTAACVTGAIAGARLATRISQPALARGFALVVSGVAAYLLVAAALP